MSTQCVSCKNCSHTGWSKPKGTLGITITLAIFFLIPAVIYEIWRRTGLGVCDNCGSNSVVPSNKCSNIKPLDIGSLFIFLVWGIAGCFIVVCIYAFANTLINGGPLTYKTTKDLENKCMTEGLEYYQKTNQYPVLHNGEETLTHVLNSCKNTSDGKFKTLE